MNNALDTMKKQIQEKSRQQINEIMSEVEAIKEDAINSMKQEAQKDYEIRLKQDLEEITSIASTEISESRIRRTKRLIEQREKYVKEIFNQARLRLIDFTKSSEYKTYFVEKLKKASNIQFEQVQIKIRKEDQKYIQEINDIFGNEINVIISEDIDIGGFIIEDYQSSLIINETLEYALENQKEWFTSHSGLIIQ